jgi:hypothetical protein
MSKRKLATPLRSPSMNTGADPRPYATAEEFIRGAGTHTESDGPKGTICLVAHIKGEHHLKLQIIAQQRHLTLGQLLEEMIDQLPDPH